MADTTFVVRHKNASHPNIGPADLNPLYEAAFDTREEAERHAVRADREAKRRRTKDPHDPFHLAFTLADGQWPPRLEHITSLSPNALADWFVDAGVEPLPSEAAGQHDPLGEWWRRLVQAWWLTPDQWELVWDALDRIYLYEVAEVPAVVTPNPEVPAVVYAVVDRHWDYDDSEFTGGNELLTVYRTREAAEAVAEERTRHPRAWERQDPWTDWSYDTVVVELKLNPEG